MSSTATASNTTAPTQILQVSGHSYAYRRFGNGSGLPLLCLQHFTGTLDNWDPAVTDPLASGREVILFENAGIGRSSGEVPSTIAGMATHVMAFLDGSVIAGLPLRPVGRATRGVKRLGIVDGESAEVKESLGHAATAMQKERAGRFAIRPFGGRFRVCAR